MKPHFILLSGGSGTRMKNSLPKQFLEMSGKPVILHSAETFCSWDKHSGILCVSNPAYIFETENVLNDIRIRLESENHKFSVVPGGISRHESALAGIREIRNHVEINDLLFFHDAARPLLTENELNDLYNIFELDSSVEIASLVSPVTETLIMGNALPGKMIKSLDRNQIFSVKTPQVLKVSALDALLKNSADREFTDLLTWGEACGIMGTLVASDENNIKLTQSSDLEIMNAIFAKRRK